MGVCLGHLLASHVSEYQARSKHLNNGAAQLMYHVSEVRGANGASQGVGSRGKAPGRGPGAEPPEALGFWPLLCIYKNPSVIPILS